MLSGDVAANQKRSIEAKFVDPKSKAATRLESSRKARLSNESRTSVLPMMMGMRSSMGVDGLVVARFHHLGSAIDRSTTARIREAPCVVSTKNDDVRMVRRRDEISSSIETVRSNNGAVTRSGATDRARCRCSIAVIT
ncbi:MAG: hypothetical protein EB037_06770 [Actinobacteria bacterium]|nr:hypothetical protein [Actinomycetota bacterium]